MDEKSHEADMTEKGRNYVSPSDPDAFVLPDLSTQLHDVDASGEPDARKRLEAKAKLQSDFETKAQKIHAISQLLKAYSLYQLDVEYVVQENKVIIVDKNTGRLMSGRRWSDGLHQAVEAKEGVAIERETQTLATITIQNYFRLYTKLAGMTGTAETEAAEFFDIYKLGVMTVLRNRHHTKLVDVEKFCRLGLRRAGHARQLLVEAEIILDRDRRERLRLAFDGHAFLRFDGLMQADRKSVV